MTLENDMGSAATQAAIDPQWYKKIWTLDIRDMSWTERTAHQVAFLVDVLRLRGRERVLDLACGFGRHALALARRGHPVVGVDITPAYVEEARRQARQENLDAEFLCADLRDVAYRNEFDVVLNLADGAIGYLEDDAENDKIFDRIAAALVPGGVHLMEVCSGAYARKHFPRRHWEAGSHALSLADFDWDERTSRMTYVGHTFRYGEVLAPPQGKAATSTRLYTVDELRERFESRGMRVQAVFGDYDRGVPASDDRLSLLVCSEKLA
jgi:2-polyprenyl-3-methyl-5-hydroxy-6-metoxy-1,4-benzoquinol methylase